MQKEFSVMTEYTKNWIREGMDVAHKDNPGVKFTVVRILRQKYRLKYFDGAKDIDEERTKVIGVECHRWIEDENGIEDIKMYKLHTRVLVPFEIAQEALSKGYHIIEKFLKKIDKL